MCVCVCVYVRVCVIASLQFHYLLHVGCVYCIMDGLAVLLMNEALAVMALPCVCQARLLTALPYIQ